MNEQEREKKIEEIRKLSSEGYIQKLEGINSLLEAKGYAKEELSEVLDEWKLFTAAATNE